MASGMAMSKGAQVVLLVFVVLALAAGVGVYVAGVNLLGSYYSDAWITGGGTSNTTTKLISDGNATLGGPVSDAGDPLSKILENAAIPEKIVIITTLTEAWSAPGSILDLFMESFRGGIGTQKLLPHLVMASLDREAYERCKKVHQHCFLLNTPGMDFSGGEKTFMTKDYLKLLWRRIDFLTTVLELGYDFVFTDLDVMWLRDPLPILLSERQDGADIAIATDRFSGDPDDMNNPVNGGFLYVRANSKTTSFYRHWYESRESHPEDHDQQVFNEIKQDEFVNQLGMKFRFLNTTFFGGFCEDSKDPSKLRTMHATCCIGLYNKLRDLRLVLNNWANYTSVLQTVVGGDGVSNFPWRFLKEKICG